MVNIYNAKLDIKSAETDFKPFFVQYDHACLEIELFDNGKPYDLSSVERVEFSHVRKDGSVIIHSGEIVTSGFKKLICYEYQGNEMDFLGTVKTSFSIFDKDNRKVSINSFDVVILKDQREDIFSPAEPNYGMVQNLINQGKELNDKLGKLSTELDVKFSSDFMAVQSALEGKASVQDVEKFRDEVIAQLKQTTTQLELEAKRNAGVVSPLQFGAVGDGVKDDIVALETAYKEAGFFGTINLGGKTFYISRPLRLTSQRRKFVNGTIIADGNCVEPYTTWCWGNSFENVNLTSRNGYAYYAKYGNGGLVEVYEDRFVDVIFEGKLGAYFAEGTGSDSGTWYGVGFSHTFMRCTAKSREGHGFTGVKGPGSIMIDCDNQGIPNGALFRNCSDVKIQNSDSNGQMKHAVLIDKYVGSFYAEGCNFEHCSEEGIKVTSGIKSFILKNCRVERTSDPNIQFMVQYPVICNSQNIILEMFEVNYYTDKITDIRMSGSSYISTFNNNDLTITVDNYYRNKVMTLPRIFKGKVDIDQITDNNTGYILEKKEDKIISTNERIMGAFIQQPVTVTTLNNQNIDFRAKPATSFIINSSDITTIRGLIGAYVSSYLGEGTIITITNKNPSAITLVHNSQSNNVPMLLLSSSNTSLAPNTSVTFVVQLVNGVLKLRQLF